MKAPLDVEWLAERLRARGPKWLRGMRNEFWLENGDIVSDAVERLLRKHGGQRDLPVIDNPDAYLRPFVKHAYEEAIRRELRHGHDSLPSGEDQDRRKEPPDRAAAGSFDEAESTIDGSGRSRLQRGH